MKNHLAVLVLVLAPALLTLSSGAHGEVVGTAFTYQGLLRDSDGRALKGPFDFLFELYDSVDIVAGNQVGGTLFVLDTEVRDGYFFVDLDFGDVFDGSALWLEIGVREGASEEAFVPLSPRQRIRATPYSLHSELGANSVYSDHLVDGAVDSDKIATRTIVSRNIALGAIDADAIGYQAAGKEEIAPSAVGGEEISTGAVTSDELADGAVTASKIWPASVGSSAIQNSSIGPDDLGPNSVGASEIQSNAVGPSEIAPNAVGSSKIPPNAITLDHLSSQLKDDVTFTAVENSTTAVTFGNRSVTWRLTCPLGERLVGGGWDHHRDDGNGRVHDVHAFANGPELSGSIGVSERTWVFGIRNNSSLKLVLGFWILCR